MSVTWMPDNGSGMKRFKDTSMDEFLAMHPGWNVHGRFDGPGMYLICDGKLSAADIAEGMTESPGKIIGTAIVR